MSDRATAEEIAEHLKFERKLAALSENATFDRAIELASLGRVKASPSAPILERISLELLGQVWPVVIEDFLEGRPGSQRKLTQAQEIVQTIQDLAQSDFNCDLAVVTAFRQVFAVFRNVEELYDRHYVSEDAYRRVYKQYLELGCVSVTLERLFLIASIEVTLQDRASALRPAVAAANMVVPGWRAPAISMRSCEAALPPPPRGAGVRGWGACKPTGA